MIAPSGVLGNGTSRTACVTGTRTRLVDCIDAAEARCFAFIEAHLCRRRPLHLTQRSSCWRGSRSLASSRSRSLSEEFLTNCKRETPLTAVLQYASRGMIRPRAERAGISFRRHLSSLAAQFLHARTDHRKIVSSAGASHVSSVYRCEPGRKHCEIHRRAGQFPDGIVNDRFNPQSVV